MVAWCQAVRTRVWRCPCAHASMASSRRSARRGRGSREIKVWGHFRVCNFRNLFLTKYRRGSAGTGMRPGSRPVMGRCAQIVHSDSYYV
eukprot:4594978-Prymnesium_polylepis.1